MPTFRVTGSDRYLGTQREVYVETESLIKATDFAHRRGITSAQAVEVERDALPSDASVFAYNPSAQPERTGIALFDHPVRCIALGIMFGLLGTMLVIALLDFILFGVVLRMFNP